MHLEPARGGSKATASSVSPQGERLKAAASRTRYRGTSPGEPGVALREGLRCLQGRELRGEQPLLGGPTSSGGNQRGREGRGLYSIQTDLWDGTALDRALWAGLTCLPTGSGAGPRSVGGAYLPLPTPSSGT